MATRSRPSPASSVPPETVPQQPLTPPPVQGGGDYSPYVWKQLGDIQQSIGRLESTLNQIQRSQDKADGKVDKLEDKLSGVTHKLYAASAILTILVVVGGFLVHKAWDLMVKTITDSPAIHSPAQSGSPSTPPVGSQRP